MYPRIDSSCSYENLYICGLARDCKANLVKNISKIESIRSYFKNSNVFIVENDSKDGTKEVLNKWAQSSNNINLLSFDTNSLTIPLKSSDTPFPATSFGRTEKMVSFRNIYMNYINKLAPSENSLVLIIDLDIQDFNSENIISIIKSAPTDWGAIFSYGCEWLRLFKVKFRPIYFDMFAFARDSSFLVEPITSSKMANIKKNIDKEINNVDFYRCISAFGGLGIYKLDAILGLKYQANANNDNEVKIRCEHLDFNYAVSERGYSIYISKKFWADYGPPSFKTLIRNYLPDFIYMFLVNLKNFKSN